MAHSLSARKRIRQDAKKNVYNRSQKSRLKTQIKSFQKTVDNGQPEQIQAAIRASHKLIDQIAAKGVIHRNTAARRKARVSRMAKAKASQS